MLERLQEQQKVVHGCLCANASEVKIDPSDHHPAALEEAIFSISEYLSTPQCSEFYM